MTAPDLWVGESFIAGSWYLIKGNLADFLNYVEQDAVGPLRMYYNFLSSLRGLRYYLRQYILNKYYTRQVSRHYDIDSRIYEMILDDEMLYTCAFFLDEEQSLESAQQNKLTTTIDRLSLSYGPVHVLDIGCGWGGLARALVRQHHEVKVCGLTISKTQLISAHKRDVHSLSAEQVNRIEYRLEDYIDHKRSDYYDAVSVVGMIEHVGLGGYPKFFGQINRFLRPGGTAVVHTIVSPTPAAPTNRWIDRHIFTGGYAPSISELVRAAERASFRISGVHIYEPLHYRRTIQCWLGNFISNIAVIRGYLRTLKYTELDIDVFVRTWVFYLSAVRNMFVGSEHRSSHQVVQLVLRKLGKNEAPQG
jgi:cyclopropane-fatty-acyl-phospholipid synthase